VGALYHKL